MPEPTPTMQAFQNFTTVGEATVTEADGALTITVPAAVAHAGVRFSFEGTERNWSDARSLVFTLRANGAHRLRLHFEHGQGTWNLYLVPRPGLTSRVVLPFEELLQRASNTSYAGYSRFGGGPQPVDLNDVHAMTITFNQVAPIDKELTLSHPTLSAEVPEPAVLDPRPVIDKWGQWTGERGEPRREEAIWVRWQTEPTVFSGFPGHTDATGADARATRRHEPGGFFRVAQDPESGRWDLIDPDGYPFFSAGCDCVRPMSEGPVGGREALFEDLSGAYPSPRAERGGRWTNPLWADFYQQNLRRRYAATRQGNEWRDAWAAQVAVRLRSWGFNTIANWSDRDLTRRGLLPYVTNIASLGPLCGHLPDVYAPGFADQVRALVEPEVRPTIGDRMLIGYFVGNEPHWTFGGHRHPFNDVFVSDEYPHTRERALAFVRETYADSLTAVNAAWGTTLAAWEDMTRPDALPDVRLGTDALKRDADAFLGQTLGAFYDICCREIRALDPDHLLLGGRFYTPTMAEPYVKACRSFDVYSFNFYNWDAPREAIERVTRLSGLPVLIGEFHYGVEGRGLTASLVGANSQEDRGRAYRHFFENAAALPQVVGCHWFQWVDQPATGRFDGESYNIGLVDVTDCPYEEFLTYVRESHTRLYDLRSGKVVPYHYPGERPSAWG